MAPKKEEEHDIVSGVGERKEDFDLILEMKPTQRRCPGEEIGMKFVLTSWKSV